MEKNDKSMTLRVFIGGIPISVNRKDLYNHFSQFGIIQKAEIVKDKHKSNIFCENRF